jgi:signal transduction histidine kinase
MSVTEGTMDMSHGPFSDRARVSRIIAMLVAAWAAVWMIEQAKAGIYVLSRGGSMLPKLVDDVINYGTWMALTPLAVLAVVHLPIYGPGARLRIGLHGLIAIVVAVAHLLIFTIAWLALRETVTVEAVRVIMVDLVNRYVTVNLIAYLAMATGISAWINFIAIRERDRLGERLRVRAARMEQHMSEARLLALERELNPHFLFNTLNTVSGLIRSGDRDPAIAVITHLGDLLRATLDRGEEHEVTLRRELELLEPYIAIERERIGPRLNIDIDLDPDATNVLVPAMVLQPLVENAIRHGIAPTPGPGTVRILASVADGTLTLDIENTGPAFPGREDDPGRGIGIRNTRDRLAHLYDDAASIEIGSARAGTGALVRMTIPARPGDDSE